MKLFHFGLSTTRSIVFYANGKVERRREDAKRMQQAARDKAKRAAEKRQKTAAATRKKAQARRRKPETERGSGTPSTGILQRVQ